MLAKIAAKTLERSLEACSNRARVDKLPQWAAPFNIGKKMRPWTYAGRTSHRGKDQSQRSDDGAGQAGFPDQTFSSPRIEARDEPPSLTFHQERAVS